MIRMMIETARSSGTTVNIYQDTRGNIAEDSDPHRGEPVNGGHLREMQDKTKSISKVENLHKREFSLKVIFLTHTA
jgi:hypothetical protein